MIDFKKTLLTLSVSALVFTASAIRSIDKPVQMVQPDGTTVTVTRVGDEFGHYLLSSDGCLLAESGDMLCFARMDKNGVAVSTGVPATDPQHRSAEQAAAAMPIDRLALTDAAEARKLRNRRSRVVEQDGMGRFTSNFPRKGDIRGLVILVEYKDIKFTLPDPFDYFNSMLNADGFNQYSGTGCAAEYFRSNSDDQFRPVFDVLGPVTLANNRSYYGGNDVYGQDKNPEQMVVESMNQLDDEVDFSVYDMDGDGVLDNVFIIYAGQGEASYGPASSVWPHSFTLTQAGISLTIDGLKVDTYGCTNEWEANRPDGVGTFIHEFSHVMGLPDLYSTDYGAAAYCTPSSWSALDYGPYNNNGCTPPNYSSFERLAMGWIDPFVINEEMDVELPNLADTNVAGIIQTSKPTEYYLFENRQQTGWDQYLPNHGMLIWHIDFVQAVFDANRVNNTKSHQYVELKKANNETDAYSEATRAGWCWPGTANATSFTDDTRPSMVTWDQERLNLPITEIKEVDGKIQFLVCGGAPLFTAPVALPPSAVGEDWFTAAWEPIEGATDYLLTVTELIPGQGEETYTNAMGNGKTLSMPAGWTSSTTDVYTTLGNYGDAAPALKMTKDQAWLLSPVYEADVRYISFWNKGQQTADNSYISVIGIDGNGTESLLQEVLPLKNQAMTSEIENIPEGIRQVKFVYTKLTGNLAIDDVVVKTKGDQRNVILDKASSGGETSMRAEAPRASEVIYVYSVQATDGEFVSKPSNEVTVDFSSDAVNAVASEGTLRTCGRTISYTGEGRVAVCDFTGRIIGTGRTVTVPSAGLYIVKTPAGTAKVILR